MEIQTRLIDITKIEPNSGQIPGVPQNPRRMTEKSFERLVESIRRYPEMLSLRELIVVEHEGRYVTLAGNMRYRAAVTLEYKVAPCKALPATTPVETLRAIAILDNSPPNISGEWDDDLLANEWDETELKSWGMALPSGIGKELTLDEDESNTGSGSGSGDGMTTCKCPTCGNEHPK